jgi:hypothetical protein
MKPCAVEGNVPWGRGNVPAVGGNVPGRGACSTERGMFHGEGHVPRGALKFFFAFL